MGIFHLAFKVKDLISTRQFYVDILGCEEGRSTETWVDFNFFGSQLSAHVSADLPELDFCGMVDETRVPIPHFGCVLEDSEFDRVKARLESHDIEFIVKPHTRYKGEVGEQRTMFVFDFSGNPIEFKSFSDLEEVFASRSS